MYYSVESVVILNLKRYRGKMNEKIKVEIIPHPYTYLPARAVKENGVVRWFDLESSEELPPYYGYGPDAQEKVDIWYRTKKNEQDN